MGIIEALQTKVDQQGKEIDKLKKDIQKLKPDRIISTSEICEQLNIGKHTLRKFWDSRWSFICRDYGNYYCKQSDLNKYVENLIKLSNSK